MEVIILGYYSLNPERLTKITYKYSQQKIVDLTKIINEHYQQEASNSYLQYSNNYPSTAMQYIDAYHRGKTEFLKVFNDVHSKIIAVLNSNIQVDEYVETDILKKLLNDDFNLEAQSIAAKCSLERLYNKIITNASTELYYSDAFEGLLNSYHQILFDAKSLNESCWRRTKKVANIEIFHLAEQLSEYDFAYQYPVMETSVFLIRQAIETHIKNSLGISHAKIKSKKGEAKNDIGISHLIKYLKEKIDAKSMSVGIDIELLGAINKWTNAYVHTGNFYYPFWYIEFIIKYLKHFFFVPSEIYNLYTSQESNIEASIFVEHNLSESINDDIEQYLEKSFSIDIAYNKRKNIIKVSKNEIEAIQLKIKENESKTIFVVSREERLTNELVKICDYWNKNDMVVNAQLETDDQIYIKEIKSLKPKEGNGTSCINEIKTLAEKYECDIYFDPSDTMGTDLEILRKIYTGWQFVPEDEEKLDSKMWYPKIPDCLVV